jgi:hypothetical protein
MQEEFAFSFGSYKGKTLPEVARDFPAYLLWIGGVTTKYSLTKQAKELYAVICEENPADVQAVKSFLSDRCRACWNKHIPGQQHVCNTRITWAEKLYHYHPYGKRS